MLELLYRQSVKPPASRRADPGLVRLELHRDARERDVLAGLSIGAPLDTGAAVAAALLPVAHHPGGAVVEEDAGGALHVVLVDVEAVAAAVIDLEVGNAAAFAAHRRRAVLCHRVADLRASAIRVVGAVTDAARAHGAGQLAGPRIVERVALGGGNR